MYGLFVDARREEIEAVIADTGIDGIQFHGNEPAEALLGWDVPVLRAVRATSRDVVRDALGAASGHRVLIDSPIGGGSGTEFDAALLDGLKSGKLAAVGLDVLPKEPASLDDPLVAAWHRNEPWIRGRVLLNAHTGFYSPDALADLRRKSVETAYRYLREGRLENCVNAEYLRQRRA